MVRTRMPDLQISEPGLLREIRHQTLHDELQAMQLTCKWKFAEMNILKQQRWDSSSS